MSEHFSPFGIFSPSLRRLGRKIAFGCMFPEACWIGLIVVAGCGQHVVPSTPPTGAPVIGTAHPLLVKAVAPDGHWLVWCEAREDTDRNNRIEAFSNEHGSLYGDRMRPYFVVGAGEGQAIDAFVDSDESGRYVALVRSGHLELTDTSSGTIVDLSQVGAVADDDGNQFLGHAAGAFDRAGIRFVYRRNTGTKTVAVVRDLATGKEASFDPGSGLLYRAYLDDEWVVMHIVVRDANGNGRLEPPTMRTDLPRRSTCRGPAYAYMSLGRIPGDDVVTRLAPVSGGNIRELPVILGRDMPDRPIPFGDGLLHQLKDGPLLLEKPLGRTQVLVPSGRVPKILYTDPARDLVVVRRMGEDLGRKRNYRGKVYDDVASGIEIHSPSMHVTIDSNFDGDEPYDNPPGERFVRIRGNASDGLVDMQRQKVISLTDGEFVDGFFGHRALIEHRHPYPDHLVDLILIDLETGDRRVLSLGAGWSEAFHARPLAARNGIVVDLEHGRIVGVYDGAPEAITRDGRLLRRPEPQERRAFELTRGPLWWEPFKPIAAGATGDR
jgi:hypothetical protein